MKIFGGIVLALILVVGAGLIYFFASFPKVGAAPDISIQATPEKIARGKYLANHVSVCIDCHSTRNFDYYSGPIVPGTEGKGGMEFTEAFGTFRPSNITPAALGNWSDGEIVRAIRRFGRDLQLLAHFEAGEKRREETQHGGIKRQMRTL